MALTNRQKVLQLANTIGGRIKDEKFFLSLQVKRFMEQDEDIRNIMNLLEGSAIEEDLAETARRITHSYYFDDVPLDENKSFSTQEIGKTTINSPTELKDNAMSKVQRQQQELMQTQENQETLE